MNNVKLKKQSVEVEDIKISTDDFEDMKLKLSSIAKMFHMLKGRYEKKRNLKDTIHKETDNKDVLNKDGIPIDSCYLGYKEDVECPYILVIDDKGKYNIGSNIFNNISEATEFITGDKTDGWVFWKNIEGKTLSELYK